jgi:hypothetical protein
LPKSPTAEFITTARETFPKTTIPTTAIRTAAQTLHTYRTEQMEKNNGASPPSTTNFSTNPAANLPNSTPDTLVLAAYNFSPTDDLLEKLLTLNLELAEKEKRGEAIVGAWAAD